MPKDTKITLEILRESVNYEPTSGELTWKKNISQKKLHGGKAVSIFRQDGYGTISIGKKTILASRAAYALMVGKLPDSRICFKDGNKTNLKWENLEKLFTIGIKILDYSNKQEIHAYQKEYRKQRPRLNKNTYLQKRYGISLEKYEEMLNHQKGVCAICKNGETSMKNGKILALAVDHDHETGEVRSLLCTKHNVGLGAFSDNIEEMKAAIAYLEKHKNTKSNVIKLKTGVQ